MIISHEPRSTRRPILSGTAVESKRPPQQLELFEVTPFVPNRCYNLKSEVGEFEPTWGVTAWRRKTLRTVSLLVDKAFGTLFGSPIVAADFTAFAKASPAQPHPPPRQSACPLPENSLPDSAIHINQISFVQQLQARTHHPIRVQRQDNLACPQGRIPKKSEVDRICGEFADDPNFPSRFIEEGCYARAHLMCKRLRDEGINSAKIFAKGTTHHKLAARNQYQSVTWNYHVAPLVFVEDDVTHTVEPRVLDPSLSRKSLSPEEWLDMIAGQTHYLKVDITADHQYCPRGWLERAKDFDKSLGYAQSTVKECLEKLKELIQNQAAATLGLFDDKQKP